MQSGKSFEDIALSYLQSAGYTLVCRNFRCQDGEIDLIVRYGELLVFVEVKGSRYLNPIERIGRRKLKNLVSCIEQYLSKNPHYGDVRLDVICISAKGLSHLRGIEID
ncbi:MAG: YraN family protein [Aquificaceae bacterium]